ncbi:MAG: C1 family peptidase, partial [Halanaerobiales bacterium]
SGFIDHSTSQYFPPIGDQMQEGSCAAWSAAYYILGFYQARERGWDYTGQTINNTDPSTLISPEFAYHLVNNGEDKGTNQYYIWELANIIGVSSLANMPYSDAHPHNNWPGEAAWREAPKYRTGNKIYYFEIDDMNDINAIKTLLEAGYLISIAVDADQYNADGLWTVGEYHAAEWGDLNHANTLVGYED